MSRNCRHISVTVHTSRHRRSRTPS
jgi:hypothetical protein